MEAVERKLCLAWQSVVWQVAAEWVGVVDRWAKAREAGGRWQRRRGGGVRWWKRLGREADASMDDEGGGFEELTARGDEDEREVGDDDGSQVEARVVTVEDVEWKGVQGMKVVVRKSRMVVEVVGGGRRWRLP